jgi:transcriptional regulator with XRE-family HTH domain
MDVGAWIKAARKHGGLTQDQVGERLGVSKSNVSAWENNRHEPSYRQMLAMARFTGYALPYDDSPPVGIELIASEPLDVAGSHWRDELLQALGTLLATIQPSLRSAVADTLAGWAREGGADHWRKMLIGLLDSKYEKRRATE